MTAYIPKLKTAQRVLPYWYWWPIAILVLGVIQGCGHKVLSGDDVQIRIDGSTAVVVAKGSLRNRIWKVIGDGESTLATGALKGDLRLKVSTRVLELRNLPADWKVLKLDGVTMAEQVDKVAGVTPRGGSASAWVATGFLLFILLMFILYAGMFLHKPGGGALVLIILLAIGLVSLCGHFRPLPFYLMAGLTVAVIILVFIMATRAQWCPEMWSLAGLIALYLAQAGVLVFFSEYRSGVRWAGPQAIQIWVNDSDRVPMALVDAGGRILARTKAAGEARILYFWPDAETPSILRLGDVSLPLGQRPASETK